MSEHDYSIESFYFFVEYVIEKGLIKKATALNWKNAVSRLTGILDDDETRDLRKLDFDEISDRYMNINGNDLAPGSLKVYRSRSKSAIADFVNYKNKPIDYSPGISSRATRKKKEVIGGGKEIRPSQTSNRTDSTMSSTNTMPRINGFPIPIRADLTVELLNVPFDLTETEAEKISMIVKALAISQK